MPAKTKKPKKPPALDDRTFLRVNIKNFGPITSGAFDLKPLTVFIGPNQSGKSYAAMLVAAFIESITSCLQTWYLTGPSKDEAAKVKEELLGLKEGEKKYFLDNTKDKSQNDELERNISHHFSRQMSRYFDVAKLLEPFGEGPNLSFADNETIIIYNLRNAKGFDIRMSSKKRGWAFELLHDYPFLQIEISESEIVVKGSRRYIERTKSLLKDILVSFYRAEAGLLVDAFAPDLYYFTHGRSATIRTYKLLASAAVKQPPSFNGANQTEEKTRLDGTISGLVSNLLDMDHQSEGPFSALAKEMESEMTGGAIELRPGPEGLMGEVIYKPKSGEVELEMNLVSSSIAELAPLILMLKHKVQKNCLLIIDEPEAHLHPANQRLMAKYLAKLVRAGAKVLIATHSDYLLDELSNLIMLSSVKETVRKRKHPDLVDSYLLPEEVSAYIFKERKRPRTKFDISPLPILSDDGISYQTMRSVVDELYDEAYSIRSILETK